MKNKGPNTFNHEQKRRPVRRGIPFFPAENQNSGVFSAGTEQKNVESFYCLPPEARAKLTRNNIWCVTCFLPQNTDFHRRVRIDGEMRPEPPLTPQPYLKAAHATGKRYAAEQVSFVCFVLLSRRKANGREEEK